MSEAGCIKRVLTEYEQSTKARLIKGDLKRLKDKCYELNEINRKRDGFLKQGINRCTISDVIHLGLNCLDKQGLQSADE